MCLWYEKGQRSHERISRAKGNAEAAFFEVRGIESGGDNWSTWILVNWLDSLAAGNEWDHVCDKVYLSPLCFEGENGREIGERHSKAGIPISKPKIDPNAVHESNEAEGQIILQDVELVMRDAPEHKAAVAAGVDDTQKAILEEPRTEQLQQISSMKGLGQPENAK